MSADLVEARPGVYHDSVSLMRVSAALAGLPGIEVAVVAMATELNLGLAAGLGFALPEAGQGDLLVALRGAGPAELEAARAELDRLLAGLAVRTAQGRDEERSARTVRSAALRGVGDGPATLALVSVPGPYAFAEAMDAIEAGLSVMIFSDNVPVEQEVLLKRRAAELGTLVMGPDCGTAVIGGAGLGFANVLRPGPVGVVAASGTGAQQVTCLLDLAGVGVSHVLGVGGRDLSAEVAGLSTLRALAALDADPATELIVLVSKPPVPETARAVRQAARELATPVVTALLGQGDDLTRAAEAVLRALGISVPEWPSWPAPASPPGTGTLRGVYSGGTLCAEAELVAGSGEFTDFGDDAYTRGRAHPMIDPSLRLDALARVPRGDVALLDVVLGHAADPDPAAGLAPGIAAAVARGVPVVVALVGSRDDPQGLTAQAEALRAAGASVFTSNAHAAGHAASLLAGAR
ncbi:FdrA family protein [Streptosporangium saharense]|uniref:FdrA protein n=1 Tax=Streptosporangium saharense TaxID=1706840 RepID=A0A7W7QMW9_9ACTN|nr:FdrA family protein [Streptosporangium saharense]MBB4916540.1 FdrA protein [Streptosporangium saharense]